MERWNDESSIEGVIRNLPGKKPPADLQKKIMFALPDYKEPWRRCVLRWLNTSPIFYRSIGAVACLALAFYGGLQFDRFSPRSSEFSSELLAVKTKVNDEAFFYLGRSLLAAGQATEALNAFSKAEMLRPDNPRYTLWKGVAYRALGVLDKERPTYQQLFSKRPELLQACLKLANNLLQDGQTSYAQQLYEQVLASDPKEKTALYYRAIALRMQGNHKEETEAWKNYLDYYRTGDSASRAMQHLHERGDFSFRNYQLGQKAVILNQDRLLDLEGQGQRREVEYLAQNLKSDSLDRVSIVVFVQNDVQQAKMIALSLRAAIIEGGENIGNYSVGLSWFDEAEPVETMDKGKTSLPRGVLIFSTSKNNPDKEKEI
jgi:tetratricopeptide (TPR) repeat protein